MISGAAKAGQQKEFDHSISFTFQAFGRFFLDASWLLAIGAFVLIVGRCPISTSTDNKRQSWVAPG